jgi:outer membrane receptor protein involved in Fe transport
MPLSPRQLATLLILALGLPATALAAAEGEGSGTAVEAIDLLLLPNTRTAGERVPPGSTLRMPAVTRDEATQRPIETAADLFDELPGVFSQATNRGAGAPIVRGQVGPANLILFDGIRFNMPTFRTGPLQYLNLFEPSELGRASLLRGSASVLYGSDAVGGLFLLTTPRPLFGQGATAALDASFQSVDTSLSVAPRLGWSDDAFELVVGGAHASFGDLTTGGGSTLLGSSYDKSAAYLRAAYAPSSADEITLYGRWSEVQEAPRMERLSQDRAVFQSDAHYLTYLRWQHRGGPALESLDVAFSLQQLDSRERENRCLTAPSGLTKPDGSPVETTADPQACIDGQQAAIRRTDRLADDVRAVGVTATATSALPLPGFSLVWGGDAYRYDLASEASRTKADGTPEDLLPRFADDATSSQIGLLSQLRYELPVDRVRLLPTLSARWDRIAAEAPDVPVINDVSYSHEGLTFAGEITAIYASGLTTWIGYHEGFRAPNLQETTVVGDTGDFFEIPNADLDPEFAANVEAGASWTGESFAADIAFWRLDIEGSIQRRDAVWQGEETIEGSAVKQRYNAEASRFQGLDASARIELPLALSLRAQLSLIDGETDRVGDSGTETVTARRLPPFRATGALRWEERARYLELQVELAGAQRGLHPDDEADIRICASPANAGVLASTLGQSCDGTDGWTTLGLRAGTPITEQLQLRVALENILDARYRYHGSGFDAPGRNAAVMMRAAF